MTQANGLHRRLYVGTLDGVCSVSSSDDGRTWQRGPVTSLSHAAARLSASPSEPGVVYLAAYEAGVFKTVDRGATWTRLSAYPTDYAHSVLAHPTNPGTVYAGSEPAAVFRSDDGGESWLECPGFQQASQPGRWNFHGDRLSHVRDLRMAPGDPDTIFAGIEVGGIVRSNDGGGSWEQLEGTHDDIHFVNMSPVNPRRVYVATAEAPFRSDDGGGRWEKINDGLERRYTLHIAAAPDDADVVLVTVSSSAGRNNPQLYRSTDGGRVWKLVEAIGRDDDMVVAMDWDADHPGRVYAGTGAGKIYCSDDHGREWAQVEADLTTMAVGALVVGA